MGPLYIFTALKLTTFTITMATAVHKCQEWEQV